MVNIISRNCISLFTISLISLTACTTLSIPDWVEGKSLHYTDKNYLLGHGIGQNQEVAEDNASRKIIQQFKSISSSDELSSQTNIIFNQIEFESPWLNTDSSRHHVLAYVSRDKAASLIQGKMLALDELTYQFFEQAKETDDLLEQTSYIDSAINAQSRRTKLKTLLQLVTDEYDTQNSYNVTRLIQVRDKLLKRINLQVDISQDKLGKLDAIIKNSLDKAGFVRKDKVSSKNHLLVELKIEESAIPETKGELLMQGVLITSIRHKGDDSIRGTHQWTFSTTATNHDMLITKSREILTTQLNANLKQVIMDMMIIEYDTEAVVPNQDHVDFDMPEFNQAENEVSNDDKTKSSQVKVIETKTEPSVAKPAATKVIETEKTPKASEKSSTPETVKNPVEIKNSETKSVDVKTDDTKNNIVIDNSITDNDDPISTLPALEN